MRELKNNEGKISKVETKVSKQGYIVNFCGLCGQSLLNIPNICPSCKASLNVDKN